jgi:hypothetical protein
MIIASIWLLMTGGYLRKFWACKGGCYRVDQLLCIIRVSYKSGSMQYFFQRKLEFRARPGVKFIPEFLNLMLDDHYAQAQSPENRTATFSGFSRLFGRTPGICTYEKGRKYISSP